jgi:S1-C subfamily serine protease
VKAGERGLIVTAVERGTLAESLGLERGDLLLAFDESECATPGDLQTAVEAAIGKGLLTALVERGGLLLYLTLRL